MASTTNLINNSILVFIATTIGYGFFKTLILFMKKSTNAEGEENTEINFFIKNFEYIALGLYLFTTLIFQLVTNLTHTKKICRGKAQNILKVLLYTIFPYIVIFCSIVCLINIFSGWLRPFSNTFGYMVVMFMGVKKTFTALLNPSSDSPMLGQIYSDKSMMINELSPDNYHEFMREISKSILNPQYKTMTEYGDLLNLVKIKNIVAEVIWYILAGTLSLTVSKSIITNFKCSYDTETMKKIHKELEEKERKFEEEQASKEDVSSGITVVPETPGQN